MNTEKKIALTLFCIFFVVYVFTSDGHRHTFDEEVTLRQATWLSTLTPHPDYIPGVSREGFDFPELFVHPTGFEDRDAAPLCNTGLLCSSASIGHSIVEVPFLFLNQNLNIINDNAMYIGGPRIDLSSTNIRNIVSKKAKPEDLISENVMEYINTNELYQ